MSGMALEFVAKQHIPSQRAKLVAIAIALHVNNDTGEAWPAVHRIMEIASMKERTAQAALKDLVEMGVITRSERRRPDGTRASDCYELLGFRDWLLQARSLIPRQAADTPRNICKKADDTPQHLTSSTSNVAGHEKEIEPENTSSLRSEDAGASETANAIFWRECLELLQKQNPKTPDGKLRSLIGKWLKRSKGDADGLLIILRTCERAGTMDAIAYMTKAVNEQYEAPVELEQYTEDKWRIIADLITESGKWDNGLGPPPWKSGCKMPRHLMTPEFKTALNMEDDTNGC
jgi:hypothetical protein